jgi:hypothetical protein
MSGLSVAGLFTLNTMGKLHTLRRAIRRNPAAFVREMPSFEWAGVGVEPRFTGIRLVCSGAQFRDGQWQPTLVSAERSLFPYRRFVRSTLRTLGYDISS